MTGLVFVAIAQLADLVTFYATASVAPITLEINPLVRGAYAISPLLALAVKLVGILVLLVLVDRLTAPRHSPVWMRVAAPVLVAAPALAGAAANVLVLFVVLGHTR